MALTPKRRQRVDAETSLSLSLHLYLSSTLFTEARTKDDWNSRKGEGLLQAILVIFGRSFLGNFLCKVLENMKNETTFVRMRSSDHLGDAKMSKNVEKGTLLRRT